MSKRGATEDANDRQSKVPKTPPAPTFEDAKTRADKLLPAVHAACNAYLLPPLRLIVVEYAISLLGVGTHYRRQDALVAMAIGNRHIFQLCEWDGAVRIHKLTDGLPFVCELANAPARYICASGPWLVRLIAGPVFCFYFMHGD